LIFRKEKENENKNEDFMKLNSEKILNEEMEKINNEKDAKKIEEIIKHQGKIPELAANKENKNNRSRSLAKNRNKKDQTTITSAAEILGYWPKREEFDVEFLNDAELEIAELEFVEDDTEKDINLKLNVLKVYNAQLEEREKRKKYLKMF
jgi:transcriptional adapter 2-alpha